MIQQFADHEKQEINRVAMMLAYASSSSCLTQTLLHYFGEKIAPCGHCGPCLGEPAANIPAANQSPPAIPTDTLHAIQVLRQQQPQALGTARQCARFLCGLSSPASSAARLRGNPLWESCIHAPFGAVMAQLLSQQPG